MMIINGFWKNMIKFKLTILFTLIIFNVYSQSVINDYSKDKEYLLKLFSFGGYTPQNLDNSDTLEILINHGYAVGFSKKHNQPKWAIYQVSKEKKGTNYQRYPNFVDDLRLDSCNRIGTETFGRGLNLGHMIPNSAINTQYGKLSQMETFLMSNISPQTAELNQGVWRKLENKILNHYPYEKNTPNIWVIVGPIFNDNNDKIVRNNGVIVTIPSSYYCIIIKPYRYPYDKSGNAEILSFILNQNVERNKNITNDDVFSIKEIEKLTNLKFFEYLSEKKYKTKNYNY